MPDAAARLPQPRCPDCDAPLRRVRRRPQDHGAAAGDGQRRYRCAGATCGWQGLLQRPARRQVVGRSAWRALRGGVHGLRRQTATWAGPLRRGTLGLGLAAALSLPLLVLTLVGLGALAGPRAAVAVPAGGQHDGLPLRADLQRAAPNGPDGTGPRLAATDGPLALRQGCVWGQPGRNPYRGTTEEALQAAGLSPEVVREVAALRQAGRRTDRLEIRTGAIRALADGRTFDPRAVALSFGRTMCLNSRVNFAPGHVELADLYEVRDARGQRHAVMVPDVCGNVSVLSARAERGLVAGLAGLLNRRSAEVAGIAAALADPTDPAESGAANDGPAGEGGGERARPVGGTPAEPVARLGPASAGREGADVAGGGAGAGGAGPGGPVGSGGTLPAGPSGAGLVVAAGAGSSPGATGAGGGGAVRASDGQGGKTGLADKLLPRRAAVVLLTGLSHQLGKGGAAAAGLAKTLGGGSPGEGGAGGGPGPGTRPGPGPRPGTGAGPEGFDVPEPGTLACVLLGLAALAGVGRRRR